MPECIDSRAVAFPDSLSGQYLHIQQRAPPGDVLLLPRLEICPIWNDIRILAAPWKQTMAYHPFPCAAIGLQDAKHGGIKRIDAHHGNAERQLCRRAQICTSAPVLCSGQDDADLRQDAPIGNLQREIIIQNQGVLLQSAVAEPDIYFRRYLGQHHLAACLCQQQEVHRLSWNPAHM